MPGKSLAEKAPEVYGSLKNTQSVPTIVLNEDFREWASYIKRIVKANSDAATEARKDRYGVAVGSAVAVIWVQEQELDRKALEAEVTGETVTSAMTVDQRDRAVAQAARTAMVLLPDFDTAFGNAATGQ